MSCMAGFLQMLLGPKAFEQMALDPYGFWAPPMMQKIMLEGDVETLWRVRMRMGQCTWALVMVWAAGQSFRGYRVWM